MTTISAVWVLIGIGIVWVLIGTVLWLTVAKTKQPSPLAKRLKTCGGLKDMSRKHNTTKL